jgi:hypothetical protein
MAYYYPHDLDRALAQFPDFKEAFERMKAEYEEEAQFSYEQGLQDGKGDMDKEHEDGYNLGIQHGFDDGVKHAIQEARRYTRERRGIRKAA